MALAKFWIISHSDTGPPINYKVIFAPTIQQNKLSILNQYDLITILFKQTSLSHLNLALTQLFNFDLMKPSVTLSKRYSKH